MKKEEEEEGAGDWTQSLLTQLKESSAQRHSLATCVLTFVFLSVVIYGTMELKAKLASRPTSETQAVMSDGRGVSHRIRQAACFCLVFIITCIGWRPRRFVD